MALPFPISRAHSEPSLPVASPIEVSHSTTPSSITDERMPTESPSSPPRMPFKEVDVEAQAAMPQQSKPVPQTRLSRLPYWISFWLGYRKVTPPPEKNYIVWIWSFIGAFSCISIIQALFGNVPYFVEKGVPSIGATAILLYGAIESPLSQPRPVVGGHLVGALTGVAITKLFLLLPTEQRYDELSWLAGSLCCAVALVFMQMTGTMHPPAGATALLAAVSPDIRQIGWLYVPIVLLASCIALFVALFSNNMQRRYPTFWWTPPPTIAPSFFPTIELSRTLTKTWSWTSKSKTLNSFRGGSRKRHNAKKGGGTPSMTPTEGPAATQDWHYALKNHSKIFGGGRARSIVSRSGSRSRDSSRTRQKPAVHVKPGTITPTFPHHSILNSPTSGMVSPPIGTSAPPTPMTQSPPASAAVSRKPSMEELHVGFQVQPMHPNHQHQHQHQHHHHSHPRHGSRHSHHHHAQHNAHHVNYLRYLAMKREGTLPTSPTSGFPGATGGAGSSVLVTPVESTAVSRTGSVDGLNLNEGHQEHARQLRAALTPAARERAREERERAAKEGMSPTSDPEGQWEDINEEEEDLGEADVGIVMGKSRGKDVGDAKV